MRKITAISAIAMLLVLAVPEMTSAHSLGFGLKGGLHFGLRKGAVGTVQTVGSSSFELKLKNDTVVTVETDGNTKIINSSGQAALFSNIVVGGKVQVRGSRGDGKIHARVVMLWPANSHPAAAKGTVKSVNGSNVVIETEHNDLPFDVSVNASSTTVFKKGEATSSLADIAVGTQIKVKGWWDEILHVLNAIKIKIF